MSENALSTQRGGSHYKDYAIQPIEFSMRNRWDFCAGSALKHVIRHKQKEGLLDLQKAEHHGQLRLQLLPVSDWRFIREQRRLYCDKTVTGESFIPMADFISANRISEPELINTLTNLDLWVRGIDSEGTGYFVALKHLIQHHYPQE